MTTGDDRRFGRFEETAPEALSPDQAAARAKLVSGPRGRVPGPYRIWLTAPEVVDPLQRLGLYLLKNSSLREREVKIAILITGYRYKSDYVRFFHEPPSVALGLPVDALRDDPDAAMALLTDAREKMVLRLSRLLAGAEPISPPEHAAALAALGQRSLVDLTVLVGYYVTVALTLNLHGVTRADLA